MVRRIQGSLAFTVILVLFASRLPAAEWDWERSNIELVQLATPGPAPEFLVTPDSPGPLFPPTVEPFLDVPPPPQVAAPFTVESEEWSGYAPSPLTGVELADEHDPFTWQLLPNGLLYHSYLAGEKEPRFASQWMYDRDRGLVWEAVVGGRWGLFRKGGEGPDAEGFQFDVIGAAFVRIDPEEESDMEAADFNAGFVGTWHYGRWRYKFGYNHYSCHLGDEYLIKNPGVPRHNYVRDSILFGTTYDVTPSLQVYGEMSVALGTSGGAKPFEFQFGTQYAPAHATGVRGAPFFAINGHLREELNYGGNLTAQAGWAWRGGKSDRLFRLGFQHYNGASMQWSLVGRYENMTGMGLWFDY